MDFVGIARGTARYSVFCLCARWQPCRESDTIIPVLMSQDVVSDMLGVGGGGRSGGGRGGRGGGRGVRGGLPGAGGGRPAAIDEIPRQRLKRLNDVLRMAKFTVNHR